MGSTVSKHTQQWWQEVKRDLSPVAGRWEQSWRIALLCSLATWLSMTYGIPAAVLSCYVLFFVMKSDAAETLVMATALLILVSLIVFVLIGLVNLTIASPPWRLMMIVLVSLVFLYLGNASLLGPLGGIIALVLAFVLTLLQYIPVGGLATRAVLYAWLMVAAPMGLLWIFSLFFGRRPKDVLEQEIQARLHLIIAALQHKIPLEQLRLDLALGLEAQQKRLNWLKLFHLAPKKQQQHLGLATIESYQLLLQSYYLLKNNNDDGACAAAKARLLARSRALLEDLYCYSDKDLAAFHMPSEKTPFFVDDAFTNPTYTLTAIKATGAAVLCYLFYSAAQWEGVHTAMITCYVATLGSTGETVYKLFLRISGALVGVCLGLIYLFFFVPYITSIGALMVLVFAVSLLAAWVMLGPERVSYAGLQIAFAFLLISLGGFGPSVDVSTASNRILGILIGNLMMYVAFTQIWPYSIMASVKKKTAEIAEKLPSLTAEQSAENVVQAATIALTLAEVHYELELARVEPKRLRPDEATFAVYEQQIADFNNHFEQLALRSIAPS